MKVSKKSKNSRAMSYQERLNLYTQEKNALISNTQICTGKELEEKMKDLRNKWRV